MRDIKRGGGGGDGGGGGIYILTNINLYIMQFHVFLYPCFLIFGFAVDLHMHAWE